MTDAIKDDQEPFNSIGLIPLESFYGSEIKLMGELGNHGAKGGKLENKCELCKKLKLYCR